MEIKAFLILRMVYAVVILGIVVGVVIWAVRHDQFKDQDHISRLPLEIEE